MKIGICKVPFSQAQLETLEAIATTAGATWHVFSAQEEMTIEQLSSFDALMGYYPAKLVENLPHLQWLQTPSAGVEKWCALAYQSKKLVLTNASGAFGVSIAEYLMTGVLMLFRHMPLYQKNQQAKLWQGEKPCKSIQNSKVTVVGLGDIGTCFAKRMHALGASVKGVRKSQTQCPEWLEALYTTDQLQTAVEDADVVALCLPHTKSTDHLINAKILSAMKQGAILLNVGRGKTVDEKALVDALQKGHLGGAVVDVTEVEPLPQDSPLWTMDNVILTPHVSGRDRDPYNTAIIFDLFKDNLKRFLEQKPLLHIVDRNQGY